MKKANPPAKSTMSWAGMTEMLSRLRASARARKSKSSAPTRPTFSGSSASNALGILEIVEMVLCYLPMKDLARASSVNSTWKTLISTSTQLQEKLFLKAMPREEGAICFSPNLLCFSLHDEDETDDDEDETIEDEYRSADWALVDKRKLRRLCQMAGPAKSMFLSQPPLTEVEIVVDNTWYWKESVGLRPWRLKQRKTLSVKSGITHKDLLRALKIENVTNEMRGKPIAVTRFHPLI